MKLTKEEYAEMLSSQSPPSNLLLDMVWAFVVGGLICTIGQAISEFYKSRGLDQTAVSAATAITLVFLGGLLTALHLYDKIAKKAGAGTLVPITGFPTPSSPLPWNLSPKALCSVWAPSCSPSPGRFWSMAFRPASSMDSSCFSSPNGRKYFYHFGVQSIDGRRDAVYHTPRFPFSTERKFSLWVCLCRPFTPSRPKRLRR